MTKCIKCGRDLPESEFYKDAQKKTGHRADCKTCFWKISRTWTGGNPERRARWEARYREEHREELNAKSRQWRRDHLERQHEIDHASNLKHRKQRRLYEINKRFGITELPENHACEICGKPARVIDHDHDTGKFRGFLCHRCNMGLGYFDDKLERIEVVRDYLHKAAMRSQHAPRAQVVRANREV